MRVNVGVCVEELRTPDLRRNKPMGFLKQDVGPIGEKTCAIQGRTGNMGLGLGLPNKVAANGKDDKLFQNQCLALHFERTELVTGTSRTTVYFTFLIEVQCEEGSPLCCDVEVDPLYFIHGLRSSVRYVLHL